uniref:Uncharacterized protein n=1 Tax=Cyanoderma ruficeps TaxID=181631 RepID=A0A8C3QLQ6_9PASS
QPITHKQVQPQKYLSFAEPVCTWHCSVWKKPPNLVTVKSSEHANFVQCTDLDIQYSSLRIERSVSRCKARSHGTNT